MTDTKLQESNPPATLPPGDTNRVLRQVRRIVVFILGTSVLLAGMVMIVSPGPAVVVIPLGLGILATEFIWARRLLDSLKRRLSDAHTAASEAPLPRWVRFFLPKKAGDG